ncbi:MAG: peptidase C25 [Thermoplasmata archaeon]|nr:MAG: peptidase C25 [Thermoplasmata archaeon]
MPYLHIAGYPMLPYKVKSIVLPAGSIVRSIDIKAKNVKEIVVDKKIQPAPEPVTEGKMATIKEASIYTKNEFYPSKWYDYSIKAGIKNGKHVIFVNIYLYPYRYNAIKNELKYASDFDISIDYKLPSHPSFTASNYDLLIIAPQSFQNALQPLIEHKESHGIKTKFMSVEDIVSGYNGRDDAEKVKYAIKDEIEKDGIKYVMLVGGLSSPIASNKWLVPVRYSHLNDNAEASYLSDLYFADVYKYEDGKLVFDDWDSNGNGIFAEWSGISKDVLDLTPDVYIGRLACRNVKEVQTVVDKIINYENTHDETWFKRLVLAGGDTFNDISGHNYLEGEIANEKVAEILSDFQAEKIWWSEGNLNEKNVVSAIGKGCGFVHLSGHGSPGAWFVKDFRENPSGKHILILDVYHIPLIKNGYKLPVVIIGGCHNSMFNTSLYQSTREIIKTIIVKYILGKHYVTWYWIPSPESMGWWFVKQKGGGAIATIGCTGLGYGATGDDNKDGIPDNIQYYSGRAEIHFFELYKQGLHHLGEVHSQDLIDYVNEANPMKDQIACKTVQEWVLLGDPTLMIGGYS